MTFGYILLGNSEVEVNSLLAVNAYSPPEMVEIGKVALRLRVARPCWRDEQLDGSGVVAVLYVFKSLQHFWRLKPCHNCSSSSRQSDFERSKFRVLSLALHS